MVTMPTNYSSLTIILMLLSICIGCGTPAAETFEVRGSVALDDKPLESGTVLLVPISNGATGGRADVKNGEFAISAESGPTAGTYRVEITAYKSTGRTLPDNDFPDRTVEETRQYLPARYNVRSQLTLEIPVSEESAAEFALQSR
ncbi:MAG: hypothetical protein R3E01_26620 [Pirellulaceae bacterium]|nr:hypothetical protein [Planctomycetales bacterium]